MDIGKLSDEDLNELVLKRLPIGSSQVKEGPGTGLDCGIMETQGELITVSSDPITGAVENIGSLAIHISCNDIASCGVRPRAINLVMILPPGTSADELSVIVDDVARTARELELDILGGHTEISSSVLRPILITTAFGFATNKDVVYSFNSRVGDKIIMTKSAAIEGTSIIAHDFEDRLKDVLSREDLIFAQNLNQHLSVISEGVAVGKSGLASAMHDATEGGILGAAKELGLACGHGVHLQLSEIPVYSQTREICSHFKLDPYRLISSGSMLITTDKAKELQDLLLVEGIRSAVIGEIVEEGFSYTDLEGNLVDSIELSADELYKLRV